MNRVVVVEENSVIIEQIVKILEDNNNKVVGIANNGNTAEKLIKELKPDIVVIDIKINKMNALKFIENIIRMEKNSIPKFIITSTPIENRSIINILLELPVVKVLHKPFRMGELINEMTKK